MLLRTHNPDPGLETAAAEPHQEIANFHVRHLRGVGPILQLSDLLRDFAAITDQPATMSGLKLMLEHEYARRKSVHLFCIVAGQDTSAPLTISSLIGCVLLFEYCVGSWHTGFFATGDNAGIGTVIAPASLRAQVAAQAANSALRHGSMVLVCFRAGTADAPQLIFPRDNRGLWAAQTREVTDNLILLPNANATLESLGKRTRTHLRYYQKRVLLETGCEFVAEAAPYISESQLVSLNRSSLEPINQSIFNLQFHTAANSPGGYVHGLRAANGRWLCLAGGWRQNTTSLLQWQMNADGFRKLSLSTAFRTYLIEHEVSLGTQRFCFRGGTTHSIRHSFERSHVVDLIARRPGPVPSLVNRLVGSLAKNESPVAHRGNFLIDALRNRKIG